MGGDKKQRTKIPLGQKITACILVMQILVILVLSVVVINRASSETRETAIDSMEIITQERAQIVSDYVKQTEDTLTAYSRAGEITALLKDPADAQAVEAAQRYTEIFSADVANLEGLYASEWNTHVLAHTNKDVVGITTREGDSLKALQDAMLDADGVYNTGIIISPASKQQIVSIYRAVLDESGDPIGLVGGGVFTKGLIGMLDDLTMNGMENAAYYMVGAADGKYIFVEDSEKTGTIAEESYIQSLCQRLSTQNGDQSGYIEYSRDGERYISTFYYMSDYGWIFLVENSEREIFASTVGLQKVLIILSVGALVLLSIVSFFVIQRLTKPLETIECSITALQHFDITEKNDIRKYSGRRDELGSITKATESLIDSLRNMIEMLQDCCKTLDVKAEDLHSSAAELIDCVVDNVATTQELSTSIENTNSIVLNVDDEIGKINTAVQEVLNNITTSVSVSSDVIVSAQSMKEQAHSAYDNGQETLVKTKSSVQEAIGSLRELTKINELASEILTISSQTNLLSLNASIEAARAGEAGKGFAVVADEIGQLADTSKNTASAIQVLCKEADAGIETVNSCFDSVLCFIEKDVVERFKLFVDRSAAYAEEVDSIKGQLDTAVQAVQMLYQSVLHIAENMQNVKGIANENRLAVSTIVEKNEGTSNVANTVQEQSEENKQLADRLDELIQKFTL